MNGKAFAFALAVSGATAFCSVSASSMDGAPLTSSKRDLLEGAYRFTARIAAGEGANAPAHSARADIGEAVERGNHGLGDFLLFHPLVHKRIAKCVRQRVCERSRKPQECALWKIKADGFVYLFLQRHLERRNLDSRPDERRIILELVI